MIQRLKAFHSLLRKHIHTTVDDLMKQFTKERHFRIRHALIILGVIIVILIGLSVGSSMKESLFFKRHPDGVLFWTKPPEVFIKAVRNSFYSPKVDVNIYTIVKGMHYWRIMSTNQIGMETFLGCNPFLKSLNSVIGEQIVAVNKGGALHYIAENENINIISRLYHVPKREIYKFNKISIFHPLRNGRVLFIPKAKPCVFTPEFYPRYQSRHQFIVPTNGWVASRGFSMQINPFTGKMSFHKGIDMKAAMSTPIFAVMDGIVTCAGPAGTFGNLVIIKHPNGMETYYAHCSRIFVHAGEEVKQKKCIALVGDTGWATCAHLHFEVHTNGKPVDPMKYLW